VRSRLGLSGLSHKPLAIDSWRHGSRFFSQALRLFRQTLT
jgi:hypothetical protein